MDASGKVTTDHPAFAEAEAALQERIDSLMAIQGKQSVESFHKRLGKIMWDECGMARNKAGLESAITAIQELRKEFWADVRIPGSKQGCNPEIDKAGRVADFLEFGELMCRDALMREESCGGHFREEHQTEEGEAKRDDDGFAFAGVWEYQGDDTEPTLHKEDLEFEHVKLTTRSYK